MPSTLATAKQPQRGAKPQHASLSAAQRRALRRVLARPVRYVPNALFRRPGQMAGLMDESVDLPAGATLSKQQERLLFLQMNYARYRLCLLRKRLLRRQEFRRSALLAVLAWDGRQAVLRNQLATANLGLIVSVARRSRYSGVDFADLISEGSMALLRAIDAFDCSRDIRFSTYAYRAISWTHMRLAKRYYREHRLFRCGYDSEWHLDSQPEIAHQDRDDEWLEAVRAVMAVNEADLTAVELDIVQRRFALNGAAHHPMTLQDIGRQVGLSKERVRQLQNRALGKLRRAVEQHTG